MDFHTQESDGSKNSQEAQRLIEASAQIFSENRKLSCLGIDRCRIFGRDPYLMLCFLENLHISSVCNLAWQVKGGMTAGLWIYLHSICGSCSC